MKKKTKKFTIRTNEQTRKHRAGNKSIDMYI